MSENMVAYVFDMDGTLTEPWFGEKSPDFYINEKDAVLRSSFMDVYKYVKPLPYVENFLENCKEFYNGNVDFYCLSRICNGNEYPAKDLYLKKAFPHDHFELLGAISEEDKLIYLESIASHEKSSIGKYYEKVFYFDDTMTTINDVGSLVTDVRILCCHSTALLTRSIAQIDEAWREEPVAFMYRS